MSDITNTSEEGDNKYLLAEQDRWEALEFDWKSWNATVEKILQQQSATAPQEPSLVEGQLPS